jgi:hypothetical protein
MADNEDDLVDYDEEEVRIVQQKDGGARSCLVLFPVILRRVGSTMQH